MAKSPRIKPRSVKPPQVTGQARAVLPGSEKTTALDAVRLKATPAKTKITVSVIVKRKEPLKIKLKGGQANGPARVSRAGHCAMVSPLGAERPKFRPQTWRRS